MRTVAFGIPVERRLAPTYKSTFVISPSCVVSQCQWRNKDDERLFDYCLYRNAGAMINFWRGCVSRRLNQTVKDPVLLAQWVFFYNKQILLWQLCKSQGREKYTLIYYYYYMSRASHVVWLLIILSLSWKSPDKFILMWQRNDDTLMITGSFVCVSTKITTFVGIKKRKKYTRETEKAQKSYIKNVYYFFFFKVIIVVTQWQQSSSRVHENFFSSLFIMFI